MSINRVARIGGPDVALYAQGGIIAPTASNGTTYYLDSVNGSNGNQGKSPAAAFATLAYAISKMAADDGLRVAAQHAETLSSVVTLTSLTGISIIGEGEGTQKPAFTVTGAIDGISVVSDNVTIEGLYWPNPGTSTVTACINVAAANCRVKGNLFEMGANGRIAITVTAAGERPIIEENDVYYSASGPTEWLKTEGVIDRPIIRNNTIIGADGATNNFTNGCINFASQAVTNPVVVCNTFLGADDASPLTALANTGSLVGPTITGNFYGGGTTNADNGGVSLGTGSITTSTFAAGAINAAAIAADAIGASEIAAGAIDAATFAAGAIDAAAIANGAIDAATFAAGAIDAAAIAAGAIDAATFAAGAIDAAAIATDAIDADAIAAGAITADAFAAGAIDAAAIGVGAIAADAFAAGAIDAAAIAAGAIDAATFAAGAIDAAAIAAGAIDAATFAAGAIDATAIAADAITNAKIADAAFSEEQFDADAAARLRLGMKVTKAAADIFDGTLKTLFTVAGGRVLVTSLSMEVSVAAIDGAPSATKFVSNPTVGTDADLCGTLDINADEVGTLYSLTGTPADAMTGGSGGGAPTMLQPFIIPEGTICVNSVADVGTGGALGSAEVWYVPLDTGATIA